mmetsp:Transcript_51082/g.111351  ORF Transcript_51082/g.111351 Transcript_51082/m.111351 type:complete len:83 (-) Transcript_51082:409-657(-)
MSSGPRMTLARFQRPVVVIGAVILSRRPATLMASLSSDVADILLDLLCLRCFNMHRSPCSRARLPGSGLGQGSLNDAGSASS